MDLSRREMEPLVHETKARIFRRDIKLPDETVIGIVAGTSTLAVLILLCVFTLVRLKWERSRKSRRSISVADEVAPDTISVKRTTRPPEALDPRRFPEISFLSQEITNVHFFCKNTLPLPELATDESRCKKSRRNFLRQSKSAIIDSCYSSIDVPLAFMFNHTTTPSPVAPPGRILQNHKIPRTSSSFRTKLHLGSQNCPNSTMKAVNRSGLLRVAMPESRCHNPTMRPTVRMVPPTSRKFSENQLSTIQKSIPPNWNAAPRRSLTQDLSTVRRYNEIPPTQRLLNLPWSARDSRGDLIGKNYTEYTRPCFYNSRLAKTLEDNNRHSSLHHSENAATPNPSIESLDSLRHFKNLNSVIPPFLTSPSKLDSLKTAQMHSMTPENVTEETPIIYQDRGLPNWASIVSQGAQDKSKKVLGPRLALFSNDRFPTMQSNQQPQGTQIGVRKSTFGHDLVPEKLLSPSLSLRDVSHDIKSSSKDLPSRPKTSGKTYQLSLTPPNTVRKSFECSSVELAPPKASILGASVNDHQISGNIPPLGLPYVGSMVENTPKQSEINYSLGFSASDTNPFNFVEWESPRHSSGSITHRSTSAVFPWALESLDYPSRTHIHSLNLPEEKLSLPTRPVMNYQTKQSDVYRNKFEVEENPKQSVQNWHPSCQSLKKPPALSLASLGFDPAFSSPINSSSLTSLRCSIPTHRFNLLVAMPLTGIHTQPTGFSLSQRNLAASVEPSDALPCRIKKEQTYSLPCSSSAASSPIIPIAPSFSSTVFSPLNPSYKISCSTLPSNSTPHYASATATAPRKETKFRANLPCHSYRINKVRYKRRIECSEDNSTHQFTPDTKCISNHADLRLAPVRETSSRASASSPNNTLASSDMISKYPTLNRLDHTKTVPDLPSPLVRSRAPTPEDLSRIHAQYIGRRPMPMSSYVKNFHVTDLQRINNESEESSWYDDQGFLKLSLDEEGAGNEKFGV